MPTNRRRRRRARQPGLTDDERKCLLTGWAWWERFPYGDPRHDEHPHHYQSRPFEEARCRVDWVAHRDELLAYWTQDPAGWDLETHLSFGDPEPGGPASRPWAWWMFDAPAPRRVAGKTRYAGEVHSVPGQPAEQGVFFETEEVYLTRLGLLEGVTP